MTFPWLALAVVYTAAMAVVFGRSTRLWIVAAAAGAAAITLFYWLYFPYTSDDAYISYRYARNLAEGEGAVWNTGENVEGYTNFLWVGLLAGAHKLGADIVLTGRWLGFGLAVVAAAGTYALTRSLLDGPLRELAALAAVLLLAACGAWSIWATAGLEAPLFATLTLGAVLLHLRERERGWLPASGAVWALVAMTRPDGLVLAGVSGLFKVAEAVQRSRARRRDGDASGEGGIAEFDHVLYWCAAFLAMYVPYFVWRFTTYDHIFPNTYYAKVGSGIEQYDRGLAYVASFLQEYPGWLLILLPVAFLAPSVRRWPMAYVVALFAGWLAYTVYVGGDSLVRFRFMAPVLPLFYAALLAATGGIFTSVRESARVSDRAVQVAGVLALAAALLFSLQPVSDDGRGRLTEKHAVDDRARIGRWLRDNVPETTVVATVPIGAIGYESGLPLIDMLGITDEHIAHRDLPIGGGPAGHEKYDSEYVLDRQPDIIVLVDTLTPVAVNTGFYESVSFSLITAFTDMIENPRLEREYQMRAVEIEEDRWLNLLVRNEAEAVLRVTEAAPR